MFAPPKLTVPAVFNKLKEIAGMSGNAVSNNKFCADTTCKTCFFNYIKYTFILFKKEIGEEDHSPGLFSLSIVL